MSDPRAIFAPGPVEIDGAKAELLEVNMVPGRCLGFYHIVSRGDGDTYRNVVEAFSSGVDALPWCGLPGMTACCRLMDEGFVLEVELDASYGMALERTASRLASKRGQSIPSLVTLESMKLLLTGAMAQSGAMPWN